MLSCYFILAAKPISSCENTPLDRMMQNPSERLSVFFNDLESLLNESEALRHAFGESHTKYLTKRNKSDRFLIAFNDSELWRGFEVLMGIAASGFTMWGRTYVMRPEYKKGKIFALLLKQLIDEDRLQKMPEFGSFFENTLIRNSVHSTWSIAKNPKDMFPLYRQIFYTVLIGWIFKEYGFDFAAKLRGLDPKMARIQFQDQALFQKKTLSLVNPKATLWVAPIKRLEKLDVSKSRLVTNMAMVYWQMKTFFKTHHIPISKIPDHLKWVDEPKDICQAIQDWKGPPLETLVISTHGNALSNIEFHKNGVIDPYSLEKHLKKEKMCGKKLKAKWHTKARVVFISCDLAKLTPHYILSTHLAELVSKYIAPVDDLEVHMSRATLYTDDKHSSVVMKQTSMRTFFPKAFSDEIEDDYVSNLKFWVNFRKFSRIVGSPTLYTFKHYRDLEDVLIHTKPAEPEVFRFKSGKLVKY